MKPSFTSFLPGILWFILIFILLTLPGSAIPKSGFLDRIFFDKWVHITLFATLVFLFSMPFKKLLPAGHFCYNIIPFAGLAFGIAMEYVQKYWVINRSFDVMDILADGAGCLAGFLIIRWQLAKQLSTRIKDKPL